MKVTKTACQLQKCTNESFTLRMIVRRVIRRVIVTIRVTRVWVTARFWWVIVITALIIFWILWIIRIKWVVVVRLIVLGGVVFKGCSGAGITVGTIQ